MRISDWSSDVCSSDLFELNVFKPLIGAAVIRSIHLLSVGMASFAERCVDGIEPNRARITELVERSLMLVTALAPEIGYDNAAKIAKHAHTHGQRSEEHTSELQSLMRISYAVFCLKKKKKRQQTTTIPKHKLI